MMMMFGPEGAQLPGVTPAGADTTTGGAVASSPSRPALDTSQDHPGGTHIEGRENEMERKHTGRCANCKEG
jgi:hypothetical protein